MNHSFTGYRWRQAGQYLFMTGQTVSHVVRLSGMRAWNIEQIRRGNRARKDDMQKFATAVRSLLPAEYRNFNIDDLPVDNSRAPPVYSFPNMVRWPNATETMRTVYSTWAEAGREADIAVTQTKLMSSESPMSHYSAVRLIHRINRWRDVQNNSRTEKLPMIHPLEVLHEPKSMRPFWVVLMEANEKPIEPKPFG